MRANKTALWLRIAIANVFIVALLGTIMRFKIGYSFPYLDQKHLQHAHSHFAFIGWITHILFALMTDSLARYLPAVRFRKYNLLILFNVICAYGMLFSFAAQGYGPVSIALSCVSIVIAWIFAWVYIADLWSARARLRTCSPASPRPTSRPGARPRARTRGARP